MSTVNRYMSQAELDATTVTGLFRGGRKGTNFATPDFYTSTSAAQRHLALPTAPQFGVKLQVPEGTFDEASCVRPFNGQSAGGLEVGIDKTNISVQILNP